MRLSLSALVFLAIHAPPASKPSRPRTSANPVQDPEDRSPSGRDAKAWQPEKPVRRQGSRALGLAVIRPKSGMRASCPRASFSSSPFLPAAPAKTTELTVPVKLNQPTDRVKGEQIAVYLSFRVASVPCGLCANRHDNIREISFDLRGFFLAGNGILVFPSSSSLAQNAIFLYSIPLLWMPGRHKFTRRLLLPLAVNQAPWAFSPRAKKTRLFLDSWSAPWVKTTPLPISWKVNPVPAPASSKMVFICSSEKP